MKAVADCCYITATSGVAMSVNLCCFQSVGLTDDTTNLSLPWHKVVGVAKGMSGGYGHTDSKHFSCSTPGVSDQCFSKSSNFLLARRSSTFGLVASLWITINEDSSTLGSYSSGRAEWHSVRALRDCAMRMTNTTVAPFAERRSFAACELQNYYWPFPCQHIRGSCVLKSVS